MCNLWKSLFVSKLFCLTNFFLNIFRTEQLRTKMVPQEWKKKFENLFEETNTKGRKVRRRQNKNNSICFSVKESNYFIKSFFKNIVSKILWNYCTIFSFLVHCGGPSSWPLEQPHKEHFLTWSFGTLLTDAQKFHVMEFLGPNIINYFIH